MSSGRPLHVSLSGDLSGDYVVLEERADGSLVVAPEPEPRPQHVQRPPARRSGGGLLGALLPQASAEPATVPEMLSEWGIELAEDEAVDDFLLAEIDGKTGFVAVTSHRFIFAAPKRREPTVVEEHLLSAARNVELVGRRRKQRLSVNWHGSESLIWVPDADAFARLEARLTGYDNT
ncbi:MAG TPA: hypothetical protein VMG37_09330 [Solirubrobacteraceae bacterium]|nr:hypothetical protein [Solirubrobacteraceae bacterium]